MLEEPELTRRRGRPPFLKREELITEAAKEFDRWLASSAPGETIQYHCGTWAGQCGAAKAVRKAYEKGLVILYQVRSKVLRSEFQYMAKRTTKEW